MAYQGYVIKFGNTILPWSYIAANSYKCTPSRPLDLDSYRDGNGVLHRTVLSHTATTIEWDTLYLSNTQAQAMLSIIKGAMTNTKERKVTVTYYDHYNNTYKTGSFYIVDIEFVPFKADETEIIYNPIHIELIEY